MKNKKIFSLISLVLSILMLVGALPMGAVAFTGRAVDVRGAMSEDENGVMVYDELRDYLVKSKKNQILYADYETQASSATNSKVSVATVDTRYPDPVVDLAIYYDMSIKGTTPVVRQGLTEIDSVTYIDSTTGEITTGKAPVELTGSNGGDPTYGGGYGENAAGETTTHYERKSILFYIINHNCSERIGQESDVSILSDYIAEGYLVVVLDYKNQASAATPYIEASLVAAQQLFDSGSPMCEGLLYDDGTPVLLTHYGEIYFLPEGCRLARDIWYYDPSIFGANGVMEKFVEVWNANIAGGVQDTHGIGKVASVEDLIERAKQKKYDLPINYKYSMNITYPSQPKDGYKAPLYIQEGTNQVREQASNAQDYRHVTLPGFALNGYATALYDHSFYPFLMYFQYDATFGYGNHYDNYNNGRAAVRCARYYADEFGYSAENIGIAGISKATVATAVLATKNNKEIQCTISGYNTKVSFGDIFPEGTDAKAKTPDNRLKEIVQPFMYYDATCKNEVSSDLACAYVAAGSGVTNFFGTGQYTNREMIPMVVSDGVRDEYNSYDYFEQHEDYYEAVVDVPFLMIPMMDQDHTYPVGYDDEYGYERLSALIRFFDAQLKPDENRAPEVLWITPVDGSTDIPVSGEWTAGPYTVYGMEQDGYEREQKIQVRFVEAVSPDSLSYGMVVRDASGKRIGGEWVPSQNNAMYTFVTDGLKAGTTYTITATKGIVSARGIPLAKEKSVTFTTKGSYALYAVADTYVSSLAPDTVFGDAETLMVEGGTAALLSYPAASIASATSILLSTYGTPDVGFSASIYALPGYKVDEATLTYNILTASDAWASKVLLGKLDSFASEQIAVDLSALSALDGLGNYVTIAIVSDAEAVTDPYIYENDFEDYTLGAAQTGVDSKGATVTILAANGRVTDGRNELDNRIYSDYIARLGGANPQYMDLVVEDGSQALRAYGICEAVKLYNSFGNSAFTPEDVGKSFRVSFRVKAEKNGGLSVMVNSANKGEGGSDKFGSFTGPVSAYADTSATPTLKLGLKANEWLDVSYFVTVTEEMVAAQAGLLSIIFPWATWHFYAWIDDVTVTECTPGMTIAAKESDSNLRLAMITVNDEAVSFAEGDLEEDEAWVNESIPSVTAISPVKNATDVSLLAPISITFDKAMNLATFAEGIVVTNETTGEVVTGEWNALDSENKTFAFTVKGFMANCIYSVTLTEGAKTLVGFGCPEEVIARFTTEGSSAVRPLVSTYVSVAEPTKHFGLEIDPIIDTDRIGVLTYSAKALSGASGAKLYLPLDMEISAALEVYAIADYTPAADFSYQTLADLTLTHITDFKAPRGVLELDVKELLSLGASERVTIVLRAAPHYEYSENFDSYISGTGYVVKENNGNQYAKVGADGVAFNGRWLLRNQGFSNLLWCNLGSCTDGTVVSDATIASSQIFRVSHFGGQTTKFYSTLKNDWLTMDDVGKVYDVSFKLWVPASTVSADYGTVVEYRAVPNVEGGELPTQDKYSNDISISSLNKGAWTSVSGQFTVTEEMVKYQASMLGIFVNVGTDHGNQFVYYDDIKVTEVVPAVTVDKDVALLVTVHDKLMTAPRVTTYVSADAPTAHYGLDVAPVVDATRVGVLSYAANVLNGVTEAALRLPVSVASEAMLEIYAIADYVPTEDFCYNTLAELALTRITSVKVASGVAEIDVTALAALGATEAVTLIVKPLDGFTYEQNFDSYVLGQSYLTSDRKFVVLGTDGSVGNGFAYDLRNVNQGFSDYIWRNNSAYKAWIVSDEVLSDSQIFKAYNKGGTTTMFYSTLKNALLTQDDVGRTYNVSMNILAPDTTIGVELQVKAAVGGGAHCAKAQTVTKGEWTPISFAVTVTEAMVEQQASMVSVFVNTDSTNGESYVYYDDIKVVEVLPTVTLGTDAPLVTEGSRVTIELEESERPVKDNASGVPEAPDAPDAPENPNLDASFISYQVTKEEDGLFSLRVITGIDSLEYECFGYEVTVTTAAGAHTVFGTDNRVYTALYGGETLYSIKEIFGYAYGAIATLEGLSIDSASTKIEISAYVMTGEGEKLYGRSATLLYTGERNSQGYPAISIVK